MRLRSHPRPIWQKSLKLTKLACVQADVLPSPGSLIHFHAQSPADAAASEPHAATEDSHSNETADEFLESLRKDIPKASAHH